MVLTTKMAKNIELIIKSGQYDADKMLSDIDASLKRSRITVAEAEYLKGLVQTDLENRIEEQLKQIGN